jgi:hypothetical protein
MSAPLLRGADDRLWRLNFEAYDGEAPSPAELRARLTRLVGDVPDDVIAVAARSGATTSAPFLDVLESAGFTRAVCLHCYTIEGPAAARGAAESLRAFQHYYRSKSFLASHAFARLAERLLRDVTAEEEREIKEHVEALDATPDVVRRLNREPGVCVAIPECRRDEVWVYSTPAGRKFLRGLARRSDTPVPVVIGTALRSVTPRFRYRMYVACFGSPEQLRRALDAAAATRGDDDERHKKDR